MSESIRVLIADDHPLFREGVAQSLANEADLVVIGQAKSGEEAYEMAGDLMPDVLLLDITMPGAGGLAAAAKIASAWPIIHIIMLTVSEDQDNLLKAMKAGARGYILKGVSAKDLANAVRTVANGGAYISPSLAGNILFEMVHDEPEDAINQLTDREQEILRLVAQGLTNREIGETLHLAEKTIKHYMTNVLQKLQVRSRVEAALLAQKRGLGGGTAV
ncbi:MAG: response regulator transcription factor [Ardenticatenaceae bacterium]|nr:response regulator transcription factor [Ardenticatenaceae bacterium]